ncbi:MAG: hypothetical protein WBM77_13600 [Maribacter sp.]
MKSTRYDRYAAFLKTYDKGKITATKSDSLIIVIRFYYISVEITELRLAGHCVSF